MDTGGTYTDAVIMCLEDGRLICKAKALTTRENLSIGVREAISAMDEEHLHKVNVVSLSSTLATNTVVEGKGCRVALICIGSDYDGSIHPDYAITVSGGHDLKGNEKQPLDEDAIREFFKTITGKVDGIAITGYMSVRNPDHEIRVRNIARDILDVPIVCGHDLSSSLGFNERTSTCIMNSRLIPIINELIHSVKEVLSEFGIHSPLMIVKGNGTMMGEDVAKERPVETILSGPSASIMGARHLLNVKDAIVMDMGGTTTDIGVLENGNPRLNPEGAIIGGHRTRVLAAEIATSGIGGDSRILVNGRRIVQSPVRVMPICIASSKWANVSDYYKSLKPQDARFIPESVSDEKMVLETEMLRTLKIPSDDSEISSADMQLLKLATDRPYSIREASEIIGEHPFMFNIHKLESRGLIQRIGLTPTDILHADSTYRQYDHDASISAVAFLSNKLNISSDEFISRCKELIKYKICTELMRELIRFDTGSDFIDTNTLTLLENAISGKNNKNYSCRIHLNKPIVGIGAPAGVYMRWVGETFDSEVLIDPDSDVGNAIGAITSSVSESISFLIKPKVMGHLESGFESFSKLGHFTYDDRMKAEIESSRIGRDYLKALMERNGVTEITLNDEVQEKSFQYGDSADDTLMEVNLTITAIGKPDVFSSTK